MESIPEKPHANNRTEQQTLYHVYPQHTSLPVAIVFIIITVVCIPFGAAIIVASDKAKSIDFRYDDINKYSLREGAPGVYPVEYVFNGATYSTGVQTIVKFTLDKSLAAPIYIQYRLTNFYQNYRQFGASIDLAQVGGGTAKVYDTCDPVRYPNSEKSLGYYSPCGALPWSMFNDTISLYTDSAELICDGGQFSADGTSLIPNQKCVKNGIALESDTKNSFKKPKATRDEGPMWSGEGDPSSTDPFLQGGFYYGEPGHRIPSPVDEDFIVWANIAFLGQFNKAYRIITTDLPAGSYYFSINELFDSRQYSGEKHVQLVTRTWIGGRNYVLGVLLTVIGCIAFALAVAVIVLRLSAHTKWRHI